MKLSILICSLQSRFTMLSRLLGELAVQIAGKEKDVEVLWLGDIKGMSVGAKRNKLLSIAGGDYVSFIDDDDMVALNYVEELLAAMRTMPDVICFECQYHNAQTGIKNHVYFGRIYLNKNEDDKGIRYRMPNHLCAVKRNIALAAGFSDKSFGEDNDYAYNLRNKFLLHSEVVIPKLLYYYNFNPVVSETWNSAENFIANRGAQKRDAPIKMDVVIVSDGTRETFREMTQQCINSLAHSDNANVIVMERTLSRADMYNGADTFAQPTPFNYNQCLNVGASHGNAEYICFSNNDIIFPQGFIIDAVFEMKQRGLQVAGIKNHLGHAPNHGAKEGNITGWCFIMRRDAWLTIDKLNEEYAFYCADNKSYKQIIHHGLSYGVLSMINVWHGVSATLKLLPADMRKEYTEGCVKKFNRKHKTNILKMGV